MILHIPHASSKIPAAMKDQFILRGDDLQRELLALTDAYTDELFQRDGEIHIQFPYSRLLVDVERFAEDAQEVMSEVGMGMLYTHTSSGMPLRRRLAPLEQKVLTDMYWQHHRGLTKAVEKELRTRGVSLIIDCHSFPNEPLQLDLDQTIPRPDICLGTHPLHTPQELVNLVQGAFRKRGCSIAVNRPYGGTMVPMQWFEKTGAVQSIMIEVNRRIYMDERTGDKLTGFTNVKSMISDALNEVSLWNTINNQAIRSSK